MQLTDFTLLFKCYGEQAVIGSLEAWQCGGTVASNCKEVIVAECAVGVCRCCCKRARS